MEIAEFVLARIAEDEQSGAFDESAARKARIVVRSAQFGLYPFAGLHLRQIGERWVGHPDYSPEWRP